MGLTKVRNLNPFIFSCQTSLAVFWIRQKCLMIDVYTVVYSSASIHLAIFPLTETNGNILFVLMQSRPTIAHYSYIHYSLFLYHILICLCGTSAI